MDLMENNCLFVDRQFRYVFVSLAVVFMLSWYIHKCCIRPLQYIRKVGSVQFQNVKSVTYFRRSFTPHFCLTQGMLLGL